MFSITFTQIKEMVESQNEDVFNALHSVGQNMLKYNMAIKYSDGSAIMIIDNEEDLNAWIRILKDRISE